MVCRKLQLQDYFQLVKNNPTKDCGARFNTYTRYNQLESNSLDAPLSKTSVPPRLSGGAGNSVLRRTEYDYHISGQIATVTQVGTALDKSVRTEYEWDGLALIKRGSTNLTNEPAVTGGNPILAGNNVLFNDMLGTTLGVVDSKGKKSFVSTATTAFGVPTNNDQRVTNNELFFTGKPHVAGLGYAFLFRNYRANLGKWQTADPLYIAVKNPAIAHFSLPQDTKLGYVDGWNNLAYCNNGVTSAIDPQGGALTYLGTKDAIGSYIHTIPETVYATRADAETAALAHLNDAIANAQSKITTAATAMWPSWTAILFAAASNITSDINGSGTTWSWVSVSMYTYGDVYE